MVVSRLFWITALNLHRLGRSLRSISLKVANAGEARCLSVAWNVFASSSSGLSDFHKSCWVLLNMWIALNFLVYIQSSL